MQIFRKREKHNRLLVLLISLNINFNEKSCFGKKFMWVVKISIWRVPREMLWKNWPLGVVDQRLQGQCWRRWTCTILASYCRVGLVCCWEKHLQWPPGIVKPSLQQQGTVDKKLTERMWPPLVFYIFHLYKGLCEANSRTHYMGLFLGSNYYLHLEAFWGLGFIRAWE